MALFKISKGAANGLNSQALGDGYCWFTYDDGKFYIDYRDPSDNVLKRKALNAALADKATAANIPTIANSIAYYSDTNGTFASDTHLLWDATNTTLISPYFNGYIIAGKLMNSNIGTRATIEGLDNIGSGTYAHVEGWHNGATHRSQHVFGEYNILDDSANASTLRGNYVEIVGNGYRDTINDVNVYSNARTLDWNGNEVLAGGLTLGDTATLATTTFIPQSINNANAGLVINGYVGFENSTNESPRASTMPVGTNDTHLATTAFVYNAFSANDAMLFKGVLNSSSDIPSGSTTATQYQAGWTYRIGTAGSYAGQQCEVGDLLIAVYDYDTSPNTSNHLLDWVAIQANVDGAVYMGQNAALGSATQPVYVQSNGKVAETTYSLNATINAGIQDQLAYYSGANAISSTAPTLTWIAGTTAGPTANIGIGSATYSFPATPAASAADSTATAASGIVTTGAQSFEGDKSFKGNVLPLIDNTYTLGSGGQNAQRWQKAYVGTADSYGDPYQPVYWDNGVPAIVNPIQKVNFVIEAGQRGVRLTHAAFNANSYVLQIVLIDDSSSTPTKSTADYPDTQLDWSSASGSGNNPGYIDIQYHEDMSISSNIYGYILVARGIDLTSEITPINIAATPINQPGE